MDETRQELEHDFLDNAKSFNWDAVKTMLRETPDLINVKPCGRWTALHQAAFEGNADVCRTLLDLGADQAALNRGQQKPADVAKGAAKEALASGARTPAAEGAPAAAEDAGDAAPPPAKKAKKAPIYNMNINNAVDKEYEQCTLSEMADAPTSALQGVSDKGRDILKKFGVKTIRGLGEWKFYKMAKAIAGLSKLEVEGERSEFATLNANQALDKKHESKALKDITKLPPSALQGLAGWADEELGKLHVKTIGDLGNWKFAQWAEWITDLAKYEEAVDAS